MDNKFILTKKSSLKGEDGYKVFSIRIKSKTVDDLDKLCVKTNRTRNELVGMMLEWAIENTEIKE